MVKLWLPPSVMAQKIADSKAIEKRSKELKAENRMENTAEYQQRARMTRDQKFKDAIERLVFSRKQYNDAAAGHDTTLEQARKDMLPIIQKYARNHGIE